MSFCSQTMSFLEAVASLSSFQIGSMDLQWGQLLAMYSTTFTLGVPCPAC